MIGLKKQIKLDLNVATLVSMTAETFTFILFVILILRQNNHTQNFREWENATEKKIKTTICYSLISVSEFFLVKATLKLVNLYFSREILGLIIYISYLVLFFSFSRSLSSIKVNYYYV